MSFGGILRSIRASIYSIVLGVVVCLENMAAFLFFLGLLVVFMIPMIFVSAFVSCFKQTPEPDPEAFESAPDHGSSDPKSVLTPEFIEDMFPRLLFKDTRPIAISSANLPQISPLHERSADPPPHPQPEFPQEGPNEKAEANENENEHENMKEVPAKKERAYADQLVGPSPPLALHVRQSIEDHLCSICLCTPQKDTTVRQLPCSHIFHIQCIDQWFTKHSRVCPLCREPYGKDESEGRHSEETYPLQYSDNLMDRFLLIPTIKYVWQHPFFFLGVGANQRHF